MRLGNSECRRLYLEGALRSLFDSLLDLIIRSSLLDPYDKIDDGYIGSWNSERESAVLGMSVSTARDGVQIGE
jgi:hypothetical protein